MITKTKKFKNKQHEQGTNNKRKNKEQRTHDNIKHKNKVENKEQEHITNIKK